MNHLNCPLVRRLTAIEHLSMCSGITPTWTRISLSPEGSMIVHSDLPPQTSCVCSQTFAVTSKQMFENVHTRFLLFADLNTHLIQIHTAIQFIDIFFLIIIINRIACTLFSEWEKDFLSVTTALANHGLSGSSCLGKRVDNSQCVTLPCDTALAAVQKHSVGLLHVSLHPPWWQLSYHGESRLVGRNWQATNWEAKWGQKNWICYDSYLNIKQPPRFQIHLIYLNVHSCFCFTFVSFLFLLSIVYVPLF